MNHLLVFNGVIKVTGDIHILNYTAKMNISSFISNLPSWVLFFLTFGIGMLATSAGSWLAQKRVHKGSVGTAVDAILGLLALILGFTFSITSSRFADRRELVVQQANAIGTSYLRTSLLPEKQKTEIRRLYQEYIDILVQFKRTEDVNKDLKRLGDIQMAIWNQTASLTHENMDSELRSLFTSSVNEVIDIASKRETVALIFRISGFLWISLFLLYTLSLFAIGYQMGTKDKHRIIDMPLLAAAALALVIVMIADMDSSGRGRFQVSQQPLVNVRLMMQEKIN